MLDREAIYKKQIEKQYIKIVTSLYLINHYLESVTKEKILFTVAAKRHKVDNEFNQRCTFLNGNSKTYLRTNYKTNKWRCTDCQQLERIVL